MDKKKEDYINSFVDRYVEESIKEDGTFDQEWFKSSIKSVINNLLDGNI